MSGARVQKASAWLWEFARQRPGLVTAGLILAVMPAMLSSFGVYLVTTIMAYAIAVLGLDFVVGRTGILSFGHAAFLAVGAYGSIILTTELELPFLLSTCIAVVAAAVIGALLALPTARLSGLGFAFVTFGLGYVVVALINGELLSGLTGGGSGISPPPVTIGDWSLGDPLTLYWVAYAALVVCMLIYSNLVSSRSGLALNTIKESPFVAVAAGVPVQRYRVWSFALSAAFAALGGTLLALATQYASPASFGLDASILLMAMLILGGTCSVLGPLLGAAFFVLLPEYLHGLGGGADLTFAALLLLALILAPGGVVSIVTSTYRRIRSGRQGGGSLRRAAADGAPQEAPGIGG